MHEKVLFSNPHEELAHLREEVLKMEKKLERHGIDKERDEVIKDSIKNFKENNPLTAAHREAAEAHAQTLSLVDQEEGLLEVTKLTETKGILYALTVLEKMKSWSLEDDFHAFLVDLVRKGLPPRGIKEKGPEFKALHMSLYEVVLPKGLKEERPFKEVISGMEQLYAGFLSVAGDEGESDYMALEIANPEGGEETQAFVAVPQSREAIFEKQLLSIFPEARLIKKERDYNIFDKYTTTLGSIAKLSDSYAYPLKTYEELGGDPLNVILSGFTNLPKDGAGAAIQIIFHPGKKKYADKFKNAIAEIKKGKKAKEALKDMTIAGEFGKVLGSLVFGEKKKEENPHIDDLAIEAINKKLLSPTVETNIRIAVSGKSLIETTHLLNTLESAFHQFENPGKNKILFERTKAGKESDFYRAFTFRLFRENETIPLNLKELSSILHFHTEALVSGTPLHRSSSKSAPPPVGAPTTGTIIGINRYQGRETPIYIAPEDRLRHLYTIGQTGTGKTTLLKQMIVEDIIAGNGVCMIDPHGSDIVDILSIIPPERRDDVIYFDPASIDRPMGLNMLEFDVNKPEQKIFVVNELFSIFQKLYGAVPESMGPMFEQYFRNSTMLVLEDPETGSTLVDVSKVLSNKEFRDLKLSRCKNPIVKSFWTDIATKASGEASLANIVPYITSKFDIFLANDIMRPIVAQEKSAFDFRKIMDEKKILLVNLSKGRLGDINANLLGLIIVGKILMAALSRVDNLDRDLPPFYLYIDEFQNITTNSIAVILSEARKYKLSLNIAHQFIAQLSDEIKNAVFGNVGSICAFRIGADDAEYLERQFTPVFSKEDLINIDNFKAHVKLLSNGRPADPFDIELLPKKEMIKANVDPMIELSKIKYGRPREEVEEEIMKKYEKKESPINLEAFARQ